MTKNDNPLEMDSPPPDYSIASLLHRFFHKPLILLLLLLFTPIVHAQTSGMDEIQWRGYVQYAPLIVWADHPLSGEPERLVEHHLYNRLESQWTLSSRLALHGHLRTRLIHSPWLSELPGYAEQMRPYRGILPLSRVLYIDSNWFLHTELDRLFLDLNLDGWALRAGRQRINWGISLLTNPHDLFNIHSPYDLHYRERPGSDALRVQFFPGSLSRMEFAIRPGDIFNQFATGFRYGTNLNGTDLQWVGGYHHERWMLGFGWAGSLGMSGFKGEWALFREDLPSAEWVDAITGTLSLDHLFSNGLFLVLEGTYNSSGGLDPGNPSLNQLRPDNPSLSRYQLLLQLQWTTDPILQPGLMAGIYPDKDAFLLAPSLQWSLLQDLDLQLVSQLFFSRHDSFPSMGRSLFVSMTWNF